MKCPLFIMNDTRVQLGEETEIGECIKEECAWWLNHDNRCAIKVMAECITGLSQNIQEIKQKMPHVEQFKRTGP